MFTFVGPTAAPVAELQVLLDSPVPTLVIHDGVNQAVALLGGEHKEVTGAADFRTRLVARLAVVRPAWPATTSRWVSAAGG